MTIFSDIASNNCEDSDTNKHNIVQYDTDCLSVSEIQKLKKRLEMELAYREVDLLEDDWFDDDEEFEAENDNNDNDAAGFSIYFSSNEKAGKIGAEVDALRLFEVLGKLQYRWVHDVKIEYGRCGSPRVTIDVEDDDGWVHEATVTFQSA